MKRNLSCILIVLFILAACVPPQEVDHAATATQEATATTQPTSTWTPEPTPTPINEKELRIVGINEMRELIAKDGFLPSPSMPEITMDDFQSGKLLEFVRNWAEKNPFPPQAVPVDVEKHVTKDVSVRVYPDKRIEFTEVYEIAYKTDPNVDYKNNESLRPVKIVGFFKLWDEKLYNESGFFDQIFEMSPSEEKILVKELFEKHAYFFYVIFPVAYLNPNREVSFIFYLTSFSYFPATFRLVIEGKYNTVDGEPLQREDTKLYPIYKIKNESYYKNMNTEFAMIKYIWEKYPETNPEPYIEKWVKTGIMPKELENCLLTFYDWENNPW